MRKGAKGGLSRSQREWAVNSLSCFGPDVTQQQLASIGAEVGRSLLRPAKDFAASREPIYGSPQDSRPVRMSRISLGRSVLRTVPFELEPGQSVNRRERQRAPQKKALQEKGPRELAGRATREPLYPRRPK